LPPSPSAACHIPREAISDSVGNGGGVFVWQCYFRTARQGKRGKRGLITGGAILEPPAKDAITAHIRTQACASDARPDGQLPTFGIAGLLSDLAGTQYEPLVV